MIRQIIRIVILKNNKSVTDIQKRKTVTDLLFFSGSVRGQRDFSVGKTEDIVCRDLIVLAQSNQITDRHLISVSLFDIISGIFGALPIQKSHAFPI